MTTQNKIISDSGGEGEVVILLHGFLASSSYWRRLRSHLLHAGYRVITIDLLGFGNATRLPASTYNYEEHIDHVHRHIQSLGLNQDFMLVGHSMGALLAARYASLYPHTIKVVFLFHPPIYASRDEARKTLRHTGRFYRFLLDSPLRSAGWKLLTYLPKSPIAPHSPMSREMSLQNVIESTELVKDLERLKIRTVLVVGKRDRAIYLKNITSVSLPENILLKVEDVSHHSPVLRPELAMNIITSFDL